MTVHAAKIVQQGVEITVPLNRLKPSPKNARRTPHAKSDIDALAGSIAVKGLLQPPVVEAERDPSGAETGYFLVTIGEGRRQALALLAKRKRLPKDQPIRCLLDTTNDAFEISLDENVTRFAMHPADQFEAFRDLSQAQGWSADEIAKRFGVSSQLVRQRLKLGAVSPVLVAAYRADDLTLDQLAAFALSDDHVRQEQVYANLSFNRSPAYIRRAITEDEAPATDARALFVGKDAYLAAGGRIRRDLFADDNGGWFEDVALLDRLALEALSAQADRILHEEGWAWAEAHLEYPYDHGLRRVFGEVPARDADEQARLEAMAAEYDALIAEMQDEGPLPDEVSDRLTEINAALAKANLPAFPSEVLATGGVFVVLDRNGLSRVERGLIRPQDEAEECRDDSDEASPRRSKHAAKTLPDRVFADLTAHRTVALRDALAAEPEAAFLAALHALCEQAFYGERGASCLDLTLRSVALAPFADGYADNPAVASIEARHTAWGQRLPETLADLWAALSDLTPEDRSALFAHCVALSVNAVQQTALASPRAGADHIAERLSLDMTRYWTLSAPSYFGRLQKALILADVRSVHPEAVARLEPMKKDAMADAAAALLGADGWLPPLLRTAAAGPA